MRYEEVGRGQDAQGGRHADVEGVAAEEVGDALGAGGTQPSARGRRPEGHRLTSRRRMQ
jgi:hypothetical protein